MTAPLKVPSSMDLKIPPLLWTLPFEMRMKLDPATKEWKYANEQIRKISDNKARRAPNEHHRLRTKSLYVEVKSGNWNRPADISAELTYEFLVEVINDYSLLSDSCYIASDTPVVKDLNPKLYKELSDWHDRPQIHRAELLDRPH
jgi:hypothetical protein